VAWQGNAWHRRAGRNEETEEQTVSRDYSWKVGGARVDANVVGREFEAIEQRDGRLTKKAIVEAARPEDSPMHGMFEWDNDIAGEKYRENQAGFYIRALEVTVTPVGSTNGRPVTVKRTMRAFQNVAPLNRSAMENPGEYASLERVIDNPEVYAIVLARAKRELVSFREKYKNIGELKPVFAVINQIAMEG
jgi:hypothetical protein